ncbi:MAG: cyclic-di-AMP receptor [Tissierellia bacterium]|nr:cyclic-di-AMP receptor [Tissierellia bacterium]
MKLIIAIIQDKFVNEAVKNFTEENIKITKLASTGGFLKSGNSTFLIGVEDDELDFVKNIIKKSVKDEEFKSEDGNIIVSGAHLFIVDVDKTIAL